MQSDEKQKLNALQELLTEAYVEYVARVRHKVSDNEFARHLGVSAGSYNQWVNGSRLPSYDNVIKLAANKEIGPRIFDVLGYDRVMVVNDPELIFIADNWRKLDKDVRQQIVDHVREESAVEKLEFTSGSKVAR